MKRLNKNLLLVLLMPLSSLFVSAQAQTQAQAQVFPNKPLKIVVGFPPGGGSDLMARIVAEKMSVMLKQPVIVDNKPGAGSTIAATFVSRAAPDGYTILFGQAANIGVAPAIMNTLTYDSLKDFAPITRLVSAPPIFRLKTLKNSLHSLQPSPMR